MLMEISPGARMKKKRTRSPEMSVKVKHSDMTAGTNRRISMLTTYDGIIILAIISGLWLLCGIALLCVVAWALARAAREHPLPPGPGAASVHGVELRKVIPAAR